MITVPFLSDKDHVILQGNNTDINAMLMILLLLLNEYDDDNHNEDDGSRRLMMKMKIMIDYLNFSNLILFSSLVNILRSLVLLLLIYPIQYKDSQLRIGLERFLAMPSTRNAMAICVCFSIPQPVYTSRGAYCQL